MGTSVRKEDARTARDPLPQRAVVVFDVHLELLLVFLRASRGVVSSCQVDKRDATARDGVVWSRRERSVGSRREKGSGRDRWKDRSIDVVRFAGRPAHLLVVLVAIPRASSPLLPAPLIVVVVRLQRPRPDAPTGHPRPLTFPRVSLLELRFRAEPRLELRLRVVVLGRLRDPVRFVLIEVRHRTVIPARMAANGGDDARDDVSASGMGGGGWCGEGEGGQQGCQIAISFPSSSAEGERERAHISWFSNRSSPSSSSSSSSSLTRSRSENGSSSPPTAASSP